MGIYIHNPECFENMASALRSASLVIGEAVNKADAHIRAQLQRMDQKLVSLEELRDIAKTKMDIAMEEKEQASERLDRCCMAHTDDCDKACAPQRAVYQAALMRYNIARNEYLRLCALVDECRDIIARARAGAEIYSRYARERLVGLASDTRVRAEADLRKIAEWARGVTQVRFSPGTYLRPEAAPLTDKPDRGQTAPDAGRKATDATKRDKFKQATERIKSSNPSVCGFCGNPESECTCQRCPKCKRKKPQCDCARAELERQRIYSIFKSKVR